MMCVSAEYTVLSNYCRCRKPHNYYLIFQCDEPNNPWYNHYSGWLMFSVFTFIVFPRIIRSRNVCMPSYVKLPWWGFFVVRRGNYYWTVHCNYSRDSLMDGNELSNHLFQYSRNVIKIIMQLKSFLVINLIHTGWLVDRWKNLNKL